MLPWRVYEALAPWTDLLLVQDPAAAAEEAQNVHRLHSSRQAERRAHRLRLCLLYGCRSTAAPTLAHVQAAAVLHEQSRCPSRASQAWRCLGAAEGLRVAG